ncbi:MAG: ParB/RepB/Spo0J family partition protein [Actinomycetota bacterium]|nr:ParB/RepB/Spo0J family partition protein [Actinomycetota bacterium]
MNRPGGLGRGLGALIPTAQPGRSGLVSLPLTAIRPNPRQPRGVFDGAALEELAHSLREVGVLQPIVVRPVGDERFEIVAGERRFRAARLAGLAEIPAVVRHTEDADLLTEALVENVHRADLNPLEEAAAYQQLRDDFGITHEELASKLGKSRSAVSNTLRLLTLPAELQQHVASGALSAGHARALLALPDAATQRRAAQRVVGEGLSVRATETLVRRMSEPTDEATSMSDLAAAAKARAASPYADVERRLSDALATRVRISGSPRRGRVVIDYAGAQDLERLLDVVARGAGTPLRDE